jgi:PEP-CTERM motif
MRLILTVLALTLLASTAEAISHRDYDGDSSHRLDFRSSAYHAGLGDSRSTRALPISTAPRPNDWIMPMFDQSDRSHHGFLGWRSRRIDVPRARVPEPTTLLLLTAGIGIGAWRLRRSLVLDRAGRLTEKPGARLPEILRKHRNDGC